METTKIERGERSQGGDETRTILFEKTVDRRQ